VRSIDVRARSATDRKLAKAKATRQLRHAVIGTGLLALALAGGCAAPDDGAATSFAPMRFPAEGAGPFVLVRGSLDIFLADFDATPALDAFLYGPNDYGKTLLRNPQGMTCVGPRLLVCDQGQPDVVAIDLATGRSLLWCKGDDRPRCPVDIVVGADGTTFVAETTTGLVLQCDAQGQLHRGIAPPDATERRFRPCGLAVCDPVLYVADPGQRCVERLDLIQERWLTPLTDESLVAPTGLAFDAKGTLLVADGVAGCVHRWDAAGQWLAPIGRPGRGPGELVRPKQVCSTPFGMILVTDAGRQSVVVYDSDGTFRTEIAARDDSWAGWTLPMGVEVLSPEAVTALALQPTSEATDAFVVVSDSLGGQSLTLLEVMTARDTEEAHGATSP
jgi:hypothetical protein